MVYITEKLTQLKKKHNKSKKHGMKRAHDSLDSDLDSVTRIMDTVVPEIQ